MPNRRQDAGKPTIGFAVTVQKLPPPVGSRNAVTWQKLRTSITHNNILVALLPLTPAVHSLATEPGLMS